MSICKYCGQLIEGEPVMNPDEYGDGYHHFCLVDKEFRDERRRIYNKGKADSFKWIPVSERLPEDTQPVLLTIRRMSKLYNHESFITVGHISWNQTTWWCAHDGDCVRNEIEVVAWMPLPQPYKAESEEKT